MPYTAEISRDNPSCFIFLIDQSASMSDGFTVGASTRRKCEGVADAVNRLLQNLVIKCTKEEGIRDYFHIAVIGYGATVGSAYGGQLAGREFVPVSDIGNLPARLEERKRSMEDGAGGLVEQSVRFPIWLDPVASNGTPMCKALGHARSLVQSWASEHPFSFPPVVINITDGEAGDGDPSTLAEDIKKACTTDGEALLFNIHISSAATAPIEFPGSEASVPDQFGRLLFRMSSILPPNIRDEARKEGYPVTDQSRGFAFNADLVSVIKFLDIGTRPSNLR